MVRPVRSVAIRGMSSFPSGQTNVLVLESKRKVSGSCPSRHGVEVCDTIVLYYAWRLAESLIAWHQAHLKPADRIGT